VFAGGYDKIWIQFEKGSVDPETVWQAYRNNLDRTLPHVAELLSTLDGKSVVSSDHGNMVGERARPFPIREWGHPRGIYTPELVRVPWLVSHGSDRRHITEDPPVVEQEVDGSVVADRLTDLGYR